MPTNLDLLTDAYRMGNVIPSQSAPSAELGAAGLRHLNDMMLMWAGDRIEIGWFPQDDLSAEAPINDEAVQAVKSNIAVILVGVAGLETPAWLASLAMNTYKSVLRIAVSDALVPSNMDHLPAGSGKIGTGASILTDD